MAGPGKGGGGATNTPKLKGIGAVGSRPAGSAIPVPQGQYPDVVGSKNLPSDPGPITRRGGVEINEPGALTVNSTPAN